MCFYTEYRNFKGKEYLFCKKTNNICNYSKFCNLQNKFILNDRWENCKVKDLKDIPKGSNRVLFERKGYLYVEYKDTTIKVKNTFKSVPDYVYVQEGIDDIYDTSLTPFEKKKKVVTSKPKKI